MIIASSRRVRADLCHTQQAQQLRAYDAGTYGAGENVDCKAHGIGMRLKEAEKSSRVILVSAGRTLLMSLRRWLPTMTFLLNMKLIFCRAFRKRMQNGFTLRMSQSQLILFSIKLNLLIGSTSPEFDKFKSKKF